MYFFFHKYRYKIDEKKPVYTAVSSPVQNMVMRHGNVIIISIIVAMVAPPSPRHRTADLGSPPPRIEHVESVQDLATLVRGEVTMALGMFRKNKLVSNLGKKNLIFFFEKFLIILNRTKSVITIKIWFNLTIFRDRFRTYRTERSVSNLLKLNSNLLLKLTRFLIFVT